MSDQEDWGPWVDHDGSGCPRGALTGRVVALCFADPENNMSHYGSIILRFGDTYDDGNIHGVEAGGKSWVLPVVEPGRLYVYRYRVRKPKGLKMLEELIATLPEKADA